MKIFMFLWATMGFLALLLLSPQGWANDGMPASIAQVRPAVVQVICYDREGQALTYGTGFFTGKEGHLVTCREALLGAASAVVKTSTGKICPITSVMAADEDANLIWVMVDLGKETVPFLQISSTLPGVGEQVAAIGISDRGEPVISEGTVSAVLDLQPIGKFIQISSPIPPHTRGGPVINSAGRTVGVADLRELGGRAFSFAIPGERILTLRAEYPQPLTEWVVSHIQEALDRCFMTARELEKAGKPNEALDYYWQATRLKPDDASARNQLGWAYYKERRYQEATAEFRKAIELKGDFAQAHYNLALAYLQLNNRSEALETAQVLKTLDQGLAQKLQGQISGEKTPTGSGNLPEAKSLSALFKQIEPAVIFIQVFDASGKIPLSGASGFFVNSLGHFITNYHVLLGASQAMVKTRSGQQYPVRTILKEDKGFDLVLAAIDTPETPTPYLGIAPKIPEVGEKVVTVGNPRGLEWSFADGIVSAIRQDYAGFKGSVIQITAPMSHGSSGGPACNLRGQVVGVATFMWKGGENLNFIIPANRFLAGSAGYGQTLTERAEQWRAEAQTQVREARGFLKRGDKQRALATIQKAAKTKPDLVEARYLLAYLYAIRGNQTGFQEEYSVLKRLDQRAATELLQRLQKPDAKSLKSGKGSSVRGDEAMSHAPPLWK